MVCGQIERFQTLGVRGHTETAEQENLRWGMVEGETKALSERELSSWIHTFIVGICN
jgi:hypothetical protein